MAPWARLQFLGATLNAVAFAFASETCSSTDTFTEESSLLQVVRNVNVATGRSVGNIDSLTVTSVGGDQEPEEQVEALLQAGGEFGGSDEGEDDDDDWQDGDNDEALLQPSGGELGSVRYPTIATESGSERGFGLGAVCDDVWDTDHPFTEQECEIVASYPGTTLADHTIAVLGNNPERWKMAPSAGRRLRPGRMRTISRSDRNPGCALRIRANGDWWVQFNNNPNGQFALNLERHGWTVPTGQIASTICKRVLASSGGNILRGCTFQESEQELRPAWGVGVTTCFPWWMP